MLPLLLALTSWGLFWAGPCTASASDGAQMGHKWRKESLDVQGYLDFVWPEASSGSRGPFPGKQLWHLSSHLGIQKCNLQVLSLRILHVSAVGAGFVQSLAAMHALPASN